MSELVERLKNKISYYIYKTVNDDEANEFANEKKEKEKEKEREREKDKEREREKKGFENALIVKTDAQLSKKINQNLER